MARMYRMPRRLSICNNLVLICTILAIVRGKWIHTDLSFSLCFWDWPRDSDDWEWGRYLLTKKVRILRLNNIALTSHVRWLSSKAAIDASWLNKGQKGLHVLTITVISFLFPSFPIDRSNATIRKERKDDEGKSLHRWHDMGTNWNHQRLQPMIDAMTPEKPHMCHTQSDDWWTCHAR